MTERHHRNPQVLTGTPRRQRWSTPERMAIIEESFASGAVTSTVALRHGLHRNQLYAWRREFRAAAFADAGILRWISIVRQPEPSSKV